MRVRGGALWLRRDERATAAVGHAYGGVQASGAPDVATPDIGVAAMVVVPEIEVAARVWGDPVVVTSDIVNDTVLSRGS